MTQIEAELLYDSAQTVAKMGTRGTFSGDRSLLFRAGDICVDVMVHGGGHPLRILHGQAIHTPSGKPVQEVDVVLTGDRATTDAHGEFTLTTQQGDPLELRLCTDGAEVIHRVPELEAGP